MIFILLDKDKDKDKDKGGRGYFLPTACLTASGAASEVPSLLTHPCPAIRSGYRGS